MLKDGIEGRIKERVNKLKNHKAREYFLSNLTYPSEKQKRDKQAIYGSVEKIENILPEILDSIKEIKKHFDNITDQNNIVAIYLLLGKSYRTIQSVIIEAKNGNVSGLVELCRSGQEAIDLVFLFAESKNKLYLDRWYKGELIRNAEARKIVDVTVNEMLSTKEMAPISIIDMKNDIYWTHSLFVHSGYGSLLDMVDIYHEDFDFDKNSGFHYTSKYINLIYNLTINTLFGLEYLFLICKDLENFQKTNSLLKLFDTQIATPEELKEIQGNYQDN